MANSRTVKLIYVNGIGANNNKFYDMIDTEDGYFTIKYGRVGSTETVDKKAIGKWDSVYREKTRKGYKDITKLYIEEKVDVVDFADISDYAIKEIIAKLQAYSKKQVTTFYTISAEKVTKKQVDEAQTILDGLIPCKDVECANKLLIDLYSVIPRAMSHVKHHLLSSFEQKTLDNMIAREQSILDSMASSVKQVELVRENIDSSKTLLDALGVEVYQTMPSDVDLIKMKLDNLVDRYLNSFRVVNKKTQVKFDNFVNKIDNKKTELFWHGSRNENWISILETGLVLRPTNAVISGKMFGYGTYFADKAQKSLGYTSSYGSLWAKGSSNEAYMSLFDVHVGNQYIVEQSESNLDAQKLKAKGNFHSTFAKAGRSLMNNEYIVYDEDQSTIKYLVQLKG
jgi:poly [ADP-ribose] polymerase